MSFFYFFSQVIIHSFSGLSPVPPYLFSSFHLLLPLACSCYGYLNKLSAGIPKQWKKRWFLVKDDGMVQYYKSAKASTDEGAVGALLAAGVANDGACACVCMCVCVCVCVCVKFFFGS